MHCPDKLGYRAPDRRPPTWRSHDAQSLAGQGVRVAGDGYAGAASCVGPRSRIDSGSNSRWKARPRRHLFVQHGHAAPAAGCARGKATLTDEEAAAFEAAENTRLNRDLFDPEKGQPSAGYAPRAQGGVLSYNEFWYERGNQLTRDRRTSLIVDPPDGRIPFTDAARRRIAEMRQRSDAGLGDSYADRPLADRCLQGFNSGPPMTPGAYNNNVQIVQSPGVVVIVNEMVHNARIIPTDGRPHTTLRQWSGDSRGRWEGDTLVVETINFRRETSLQGSSANTRLVERFTRVDAETIKYEFTVTDPTTYTRPWSAMVPLIRIRRTALRVRLPRG